MSPASLPGHMAADASTGTDGELGDRAGAVAGVSRLPFLALPVVLGLLGGAAGVAAGAFSPILTVVATLGLVAAHVAVNALNEAHDYETGIDEKTEPTPFSGGSGTIPEDDLSPRGARAVGYVGLALALAAGLYTAVVAEPLVLLLAAAGFVTIVGYTPVFTKLGLGEVVAGLGLGSLPVVGLTLVQRGPMEPLFWVVSVPPFFLTFNLLLLNEFPDVEADRAGGRKNLVHRFGRVRAGQIYVAAGLAVPLSILGGVVAGVLPVPALLGVVPSVLFVRPAKWALSGAEGDVPVSHLRDNVVWILATNAALAVGLVVSAVV